MQQVGGSGPLVELWNVVPKCLRHRPSCSGLFFQAGEACLPAKVQRFCAVCSGFDRVFFEGRCHDTYPCIYAAAAVHQGDAERSAALERQVEAGRAERATLLREVEQVRSDKERAVVDKERAAIEAERQAHALRAEAAQQRRQLEGARRRCQHLEGEAQQAGAEREVARQRVGQLEQEHQRASAEVERTIHTLE